MRGSGPIAWSGPTELGVEAVYARMLGRSARVEAAIAPAPGALEWVAGVPEECKVEIALLTLDGGAGPGGFELARTLVISDIARERLSALEDRGDLRVRTFRRDPDAVLPDTVWAQDEVGGRTLIRRTGMTVDGRPVEHVLVFRDVTDRHHVEAGERELSQLFARGAEVAGEAAQDATVRDGLRGYQARAIDAWAGNGRRGVLSMATGTGKTRTAIQAADELRLETEGLATVVLAPLTHLVDQWVDRFEDAGERAIACHTSSSAWAPRANEAVDLVRSRARQSVTLVATYATAGLPDFQGVMERISPERFLLVVDEVHNLGTSAWSALLVESAWYRLGLSATPERWGDPEGTETLLDYFGGIVFEYGLADAIDDGVLTPYRYELEGFQLEDEDLSAFRDASSRYAALLRSERPDPTVLEQARTRRADAIDRASGKVEHLRKALRRNTPDRTVVYCSGREQLDAVITACWQEGYTAHPFTGEESAAERRRILQRFGDGDVPILGAIRCLDEGVDIPEAREAYLLRSSGNPAQYIQRRGRLLRPHKDKKEAIIRDLVPTDAPTDVTEVESERVTEFASSASNGAEALERFREMTGAGR